MKRDHPFMSIVIPTYNRPRQLADCLRSCSRLEYPRDRFEVIVVDDGGVAPLDEVIEPFHHLLRLKLLRQKKTGPAAARNAGACAADGEFLVFTDDDCAPAPDWLEVLAARFAASPDCAVGGHTANVLTHNLYSTASQLLVSYIIDLGGVHENVRFFPSSNLGFQTARFRDMGGFNVSFPQSAGEDRELCDRWQQRGYGMLYAPEAVVYHSHQLTAKTFLRQHFIYGTGAYRYHFIRSHRQQQSMKLEPPAFYVNMLLYPFKQVHFWTAMRVLPLLILSQAVNAVGFFLEHARRKKSAIQSSYRPR